MMKKLLPFVCFVCFSIVLVAQEGKSYSSTVSGFVKNDVFYDTREVVSARDGHFLLWPSAVSLDSVGVDVNDAARFNMLAIQSRFTYRFSGPDVLGAKVSGLIEGDFFGNANAAINVFRMRHAFLKLNWTNTEVISGQFWNPFFVTSCFPGTISFNTGTPFNSFARNPQMRVTHTMGKLSFMAAVLSQVDNVSRGYAGGASTMYLRNSAIPDIHAQLAYATKNDSTKTAFLIGGGVSYKNIQPRNISNGFAVSESVEGISALAFTKLTTEAITIKASVRYGENIPDLTAPGGFAIKEVVNAITGESVFTPLTSLSYWGEVHTNGTNWELGVFGGMFVNTGTKEKMNSAANSVFGLATNIASMYRVSPRVMYKVNKFSTGIEYEYTVALYGAGFDAYYKPATSTNVSNSRILFTTIYAF